jgi:hypothetical protein
MTSTNTTFSDYDWMELVAFDSKVGSEGFTYAYENYPPAFESAELQQVADDMGAFRRFCLEHDDAVEAWWREHDEDGADLHNAHIDERNRRDEEACLWGVRRPDGHVFGARSQFSAQTSVDYMNASTDTYWTDQGFTEPVRVMSREVPGGEWQEVAS